MVFQKPTPFPMTIYENIAFGVRLYEPSSKSELDGRIEDALKRAALWDEVKDKLDASGLSLSGGQQQRLCIARTMMTPASSAQAAQHGRGGRAAVRGAGRDATAISLTPATWAVASITTDDGYATRPPGASAPARRTGACPFRDGPAGRRAGGLVPWSW